MSFPWERRARIGINPAARLPFKHLTRRRPLQPLRAINILKSGKSQGLAGRGDMTDRRCNTMASRRLFWLFLRNLSKKLRQSDGAAPDPAGKGGGESSGERQPYAPWIPAFAGMTDLSDASPHPFLQHPARMQFRDQRREVFGEAAPAAKTLRVDRSLHLRSAGGAHFAVNFVEAGAILVRRQIEMGEHARERPFEVANPVRQRDGKDRVGQHGAPMRHQPRPLSDRPAEIGEVMRVGVLAIEAVGPDRKPDVAQIAHAIDDFRA